MGEQQSRVRQRRESRSDALHAAQPLDGPRSEAFPHDQQHVGTLDREHPAGLDRALPGFHQEARRVGRHDAIGILVPVEPAHP
jgi:hypothetical protein